MTNGEECRRLQVAEADRSNLIMAPDPELSCNNVYADSRILHVSHVGHHGSTSVVLRSPTMLM